MGGARADACDHGSVVKALLLDQRLVGEVKKPPKPLGILRRSRAEQGNSDVDGQSDQPLEVAEVIKWKILFQGRPEPV